MDRTTVFKAAMRSCQRSIPRTRVHATARFSTTPSTSRLALCRAINSQLRPFSSCTPFRTQFTDAPTQRPTETHKQAQPAQISQDEYAKRSDAFFEELLERLEELQEERGDMDVEYAAGVLNVSFQSTGHTYVLNKQPPNKQIWLSSPVSGPKRYDWVIFGEGQSEKEGAGSGGWIYLRDNSSLRDLLKEELGVELEIDHTEH